MDISRGGIRDIDRYRQLNDFSGLQFEHKITPTDIDMFVDFGNKAFVVGEGKFGTVDRCDLKYGQRLALDRLIDACCKVGPTIGIIWVHQTPANDLVPVADCEVAKIVAPKEGLLKWRKPKRYLTVRKAIEQWREKIRI